MTARAALCLALALLAGCAARPVEVGGDPGALWRARSARLAALSQWDLKGRIAVQVEREAWSASLLWQQRAGTYVMRVSAPLARGAFELSGSAGGVTLRTADNRVLQAGDPEALLEQALGWHLPVSGLYYWIRGLPDPGGEPQSMHLDDRGRVSDLSQDGWRISYERYAPEGGIDLPGRMTLENDRVRVRLVISDWGPSS